MSSVLFCFAGVPAEMYRNGAEFWLVIVGQGIAIPVIATLYVPIFYKCGLTSVFEYIHHR